MVNICELLVNVVIAAKLKMLKTSKGRKLESQKARDQVAVLLTHRSQTVYPRRRGRT
jgi:hypothetical protein